MLKRSRYAGLGYVLLAGAILAGGAYTTWRTYNSSTDFDTYYFAAKRILDGVFLYQEVSGLSPYIYPPFFACILSPLALIGLGPAAFLWYLFNIALIWFSLSAMSLLVFGDPDFIKALGRFRFFPKAVALGVSAAIFLDNLSILQVNILTFAVALAGIYLIRLKRPFAASAAFAFSISVKVIPAVFFLYFLVKRQFKIAASIALFTIVFSVLVPAASLGPGAAPGAFRWWIAENFGKSTGKPNFQMMDNMFNPKNQSVTAALSRWMVKNDGNVLYWKKISHEYPEYIHNITLGLDASVVVGAAKALSAAIVILTLVAVALPKKRAGPEQEIYEYSLVFLASLLTTPILKSQHFSFVIFPVMTALWLTEKAGRFPGRFMSRSLAIFLTLYAAVTIPLTGIMGAGALAVVFLWAAFLLAYIRSSPVLT